MALGGGVIWQAGTATGGYAATAESLAATFSAAPAFESAIAANRLDGKLIAFWLDGKAYKALHFLRNGGASLDREKEKQKQ